MKLVLDILAELRFPFITGFEGGFRVEANSSTSCPRERRRHEPSGTAQGNEVGKLESIESIVLGIRVGGGGCYARGLAE